MVNKLRVWVKQITRGDFMKKSEVNIERQFAQGTSFCEGKLNDTLHVHPAGKFPVFFTLRPSWK